MRPHSMTKNWTKMLAVADSPTNSKSGETAAAVRGAEAMEGKEVKQNRLTNTMRRTAFYFLSSWFALSVFKSAGARDGSAKVSFSVNQISSE